MVASLSAHRLEKLLVKDGARRADSLTCWSCSGACLYVLNLVMETPGYQWAGEQHPKTMGQVSGGVVWRKGMAVSGTVSAVSQWLRTVSCLPANSKLPDVWGNKVWYHQTINVCLAILDTAFIYLGRAVALCGPKFEPIRLENKNWLRPILILELN